MRSNFIRNGSVSILIGMNSIGAHEVWKIQLLQHPGTYIQETAVFFDSDIPNGNGIPLLPSADAFRIIFQVMKNVFTIPVPGNPLEISGTDQRQTGYQNRFQLPLPCFFYESAKHFAKVCKGNLSIMEMSRVIGYGIPIQITVISSELNYTA